MFKADTPIKPQPGQPDEPSFTEAVEQAIATLPAGATGAQVWAALGAAGLLAAMYVGERPGHRVDPRRLSAVLSAVDAQGRQGPTLMMCVHAATAVPLLAEAASHSPYAAQVLEQVLRGTETVALAATDAGAGSDLAGLQTTVNIGEKLEITGNKRWITGAGTADHLLVLARRKTGRHFTNFTWVLVPTSNPGVDVNPAGDGLFAGSGLGHVDLRDIVLPKQHLVGRTGLGLATLTKHMATERLSSALWAVALCRRVLEQTKTWLADREIDNGRLWNSDAVRHRLARCAVEVRKLHALCESLGHAAAIDQDATAGALLKSASGPIVDLVLSECAQLQGADGFAGAGVQWLRAEAAAFGIGGGATEVVLSFVADHIDHILAQVIP